MAESKMEKFNDEVYKLTSENNMPHITEVQEMSADMQREVEEAFQLNA